MPPQHSFNLHRELEEHNAFFDALVDMIPAKLYVAGNSGDDQYNPKYFKGQNKESKEARRARNKAAKRIKFDPEKAETTRQVKERLARQEEEQENSLGSGETKREQVPATPEQAPQKGENIPSSASRIEALRAKLQAKLAEKRSQRPSDPNTVSKRAARRAEKQRRQEEAKKRHSMSKVETHSKKYMVSSDANATPQADLEKLDFGRLAGLNPTPKNYTNNKSLANLNKKKNLQKMLEIAEEKKKRLEELKRSNSDQDKDKAAQMVWKDALKEASGERVKDDPVKLRKALKRKMAKKEKSAKAWKSRMEQTKQKMDDRQKIRAHNLDMRKKGGQVGANLSKKRIVGEEEESKKGRRQSRAGFEGKKQGFLNQTKTPESDKSQ